MMPDLGAYAVAVLSAYAAAGALIVALVAISLWQAARVRRRLQGVEARQVRREA